MPSNLHSKCPPASLIKQIAAMIYDSLLIIAILFISTAIALIFNDGKAFESSPIFSFYLVLIIFIFYSWFWKKSGQTLGMRVWKIRIISELGGNPSWAICFLRLTFALLSIACFGIGYWWRLFKPYTWHDKLSQTRIISLSELPKEQQ
jgi:uncharacterized RDD family membrane protein YckC|tara:strand:+ start:256 stop:699 length:444 start_codon:yes stop_codon:yes gene_type:complete